jgi:hypothetical protein
VYEGQAVRYDVKLHNIEENVTPELGPLDDFDVTPLGPRTSESRQIRIINGQREEIVDRSTQYAYRLVPRKTGTLTIPAPQVKVAGQVLKGEAQTLKVLPADSQDIVLAEILCDRPSVYPMQTFTVTLRVLVKEMPKPHAERDPLSVQNSPPALQIPWVADEQLPEDLKPQSDQSHWLATLRPDSSSGFSINRVVRRAGFGLFGEESLSFAGKRDRVKRRDKSGNEVGYWQYEYPRRFVAKRPGTYGFGPASVQGAFATRQAERGLIGQEIYAVGKRIEVVVKDVPAEGRPETFTGAVGHFELAAELKPERARIGDPMTLTLTLRGEGTLETARAPDLKRVKEITDHFRIDEPSDERKDNLCRFTYSLRPTDVDAKAFPAVALAYFDVQTEKYETLHTAPIPVEVVKAERLSSDQIVATPRVPGGQGELEARREGIFANITELAAVRDESVRPERWALGLGGLAGLYAVLAVVVVRIQRLAGDPAVLRRRQAAVRARRQLHDALAALGAGQTRQEADALQGVLVGLVADVADLVEAGLTPKDVRDQLGSLGMTDELTERVGRLLDACDAARYGALAQGLPSLGCEAEAVLEELLQTLKAKKRLR